MRPIGVFDPATLWWPEQIRIDQESHPGIEVPRFEVVIQFVEQLDVEIGGPPSPRVLAFAVVVVPVRGPHVDDVDRWIGGCIVADFFDDAASGSGI